MTGQILRIIAEALEKIAGVFDGKDPCKCVGPKEAAKLADHAAHEETVRQVIEKEAHTARTECADAATTELVEVGDCCGETEDPTPPTVPPGAFAPPAPPAPQETTGGPELDAEGLPWDSRIHASTRTRNKDETWRLLRGVDQGLVDQVKAELKAAMSAPVPKPAAQASPPPPPAAPAETPASPPPPPAASSDDQPPVSFAGFVQAITKKQAAGLLTVQEINEVCVKHGLAQMPLLVNRLDLIPAIYSDLRAIWATRG